MGVRHPTYPSGSMPVVMTTDILLDVVVDGRPMLAARAIKPAADLDDARILEKLEIDQIRQAERRATAWAAPANHEAKARRNDRVRQIADAASEATSAARDPSATKAGLLRDIRASRSAEREALQKERAVVARHRPASDGQQVIPFAKPAEPDDDEPSIADVKAYLRAQLEDGGDDG